MAFGITIGVLPDLSTDDEFNGLYAGLPMALPDPTYDYCGGLDTVLVEGTRDIESNLIEVANLISIPQICWDDSGALVEVLNARMMRWDIEGRQWAYGEPNFGQDSRVPYPDVAYPRISTRIADIVLQLNMNYRRPGDEQNHRNFGHLSDLPLGSSNTTAPVNPGQTTINLTGLTGGIFFPDHYALLGSISGNPEVVLVTAVSGTQIEVIRGQLGTADQSHAGFSPVTYDVYCNPHHAYVVAKVDTVDADTLSRKVYTPGATPTGSNQNFEPIIQDQDGDFESRGLTFFLRENANPESRDGGDTIVHLTVLTPLWTW